MPIVQIHLMHGRDSIKKKQLVRIILSEMMPENYAIEGELVQDQKDPFGKSTK